MALNPRPDPVDSPAVAVDELTARWRALHEAAGIVAVLARAPVPVCDAGPGAFPAALRRAGGWRATLGRQAMADLGAILEGGLTALLAVHASGADPHAAAQALWAEFLAARDGLLALVPGGGSLQSS